MLGASSDDFYENSFRRGVAAFDAGSYDVAVGRLRIAAFGFMEDVVRYETAEAYLAVAEQRLKQPAEATKALNRIVAAEKAQRHFASLDLPPAVRGAVLEAAKALLPPQQVAMLSEGPAPPPRTETIVVPMDPDPAAALLDDARRALDAGDLKKAKTIYTQLLAPKDVPHATLLRIGEGLTRARDFRGAVTAFDRAGAFAKGEEPYRYYYAVALYERRRYKDAKRELAAALPFIEMSADVQQYRAKIDAAR